MTTRNDGRRSDELRLLDLIPDFLEQPHGSVLYAQGKTKLLCTASIQEGVPRWLSGKGRGWLTAEYSLLPASTGDRTDREASRGKQGGRTIEIQRLIGRSIRSVTDFEALGERTLWIDCDVLQADGALVEVQATAEKTPFSRARLDDLLELAAVGIEELAVVQEEAVAAARV
jgi:ribonuclease PH